MSTRLADRSTPAPSGVTQAPVLACTTSISAVSNWLSGLKLPHLNSEACAPALN